MIKTFYFNDLRTSCYVLYDNTKECAIVDPGCYSEKEKERLVKFIDSFGLVPKMIINTHGHFDHIMGNAFVADKWNIPTYMNHGDIPQLSRSKSYGGYFGYEFNQPTEDVIDLKDGDVIRIGDIVLNVFHTPGHSNGGVALYNEQEKYVICGDSLFAGSIGRTDLPGGDFDLLITSIRTKLLTLPPDTTAYPGHGPATTIGDEMANNPFLR